MHYEDAMMRGKRNGDEFYMMCSNQRRAFKLDLKAGLQLLHIKGLPLNLINKLDLMACL